MPFRSFATFSCFNLLSVPLPLPPLTHSSTRIFTPALSTIDSCDSLISPGFSCGARPFFSSPVQFIYFFYSLLFISGPVITGCCYPHSSSAFSLSLSLSLSLFLSFLLSVFRFHPFRFRSLYPTVVLFFRPPYKNQMHLCD
ncbi:MAG: hypothetical protein BYD32DRAFT_76810 [Podila humilis]|nr:MAG: hypothetical protein BYD32DRAFT_76810 [Podila humilis]